MVSKTIEKTLNPLWNEEFIYHGITDEDHLKKSLRIVVLDRDRIGSDFLGEVNVPLQNLQNDEETIYNLCLEQAITEVILLFKILNIQRKFFHNFFFVLQKTFFSEVILVFLILRGKFLQIEII